jgi:hypothetical protein
MPTMRMVKRAACVAVNRVGEISIEGWEMFRCREHEVRKQRAIRRPGAAGSRGLEATAEARRRSIPLDRGWK